MPLVIPVTVECNTPEQQILDNVLANSKRTQKWLKHVPAHDRTAIICGSGPSIADCLDEIKYLKGDVFALNNAAKWLHEKGIKAEYQVIMDAQPRTLELVGPAWKHLFASMVDPALFDLAPDAILWHATHGNLMVDEQPGFPKAQEDYCLIGSGITVGNTSLPLVYAMGYRQIHIFGMDSCHRGTAGHVLSQPLNDGDPCTLVDFRGRQYVCSFTMKLQADNFIHRAELLQDEGCSIQLHGDGYLQALWAARSEKIPEQEKYQRIWEYSEYRQCSPGERIAETFVDIARPGPAETVVDLGCGTGRGGKMVRKLSGCQVIFVDFASNCIEDRGGQFVQADLAKPIPVKGDIGYCCDVMEHIPPDQVDAVLENVCKVCPSTFFQIALFADTMGELIGQRLHLSVHSADWWLHKLQVYGRILFFEDRGDTAIYYITSTTRGD